MRSLRLCRGIGVVVLAGALVSAGCSASEVRDENPNAIRAAQEHDPSKEGRPVVTEFSEAPAVGTMMPNFGQKPVDRSGSDSASDASFSVTIDEMPETAEPGRPFHIVGHTTGFAPGEWVNVWLRAPDGSQMDVGGQISGDASFEIEATGVVPGENTFQVSAGTFPEEEWSEPKTIRMEKGGRESATYVYNNLEGHTLVYASIVDEEDREKGTYVRFNPCYPVSESVGKCLVFNGLDTGEHIYVGSDAPGPDKPDLANLAPGTLPSEVWVAWIEPRGEAPTGFPKLSN